MNELFIAEHQDAAEQEFSCYGYCLDNAITNYMESNFGRAAAYLENAARSLRELQILKSHKQAQEQAMKLLNELDGDSRNQALKRLTDREMQMRRDYF